MAKSQAQLHTSPVTDPLVRVRVTRRGHGRISTGERDGINGDIVYEKGDEFEIAKSVADRLVGDDPQNPNNSKDWVEIIEFEKDDDAKRGPGRPPKAAE